MFIHLIGIDTKIAFLQTIGRSEGGKVKEGRGGRKRVRKHPKLVDVAKLSNERVKITPRDR